MLRVIPGHSSARSVTIGNTSGESVGVCGRILKSGASVVVALSDLQGNLEWANQLYTLVLAGKISVSFGGRVLTAAQILTMDAPLSFDLGTPYETLAVTHVYADGTLGDDNNDGLEKSAGTGGSFSFAAGVVTFTGTGASWSAADIGRLVTINSATSSGNSISALITSVPAVNQITYANARGVTESFTGTWSVSSPKKTRAAVYSLVPYFVKHNTCVHLSGAFTDAATTLERFVHAGVSLVVDGGSATTIVDDNGGANYTSDIASAATIGLSTAGWVADANRGKWVEVLSGPALGQTRTIQIHDATTITPIRSFSTSPVAGATFRIVRPTTTITGGDLVLRNTGSGNLWAQRIYVSGATCSVAAAYSVGPVNLTHIVTDGSKLAAVSLQYCPNLGLLGYMINPATFASGNLTTETHCGVSQTGASGWGTYVLSCGLTLMYGVVAKSVLAYKSTAVQVNRGGRVLFAYLNGCPTNGLTTPNFGVTTGYATTRFGGHPVFAAGAAAIWMNYSSLCVGAGVDVSGSLHGIEINHSQLRLEAVTGTNTGAGCYARMMSSVQLKSGSTPTLTGTAAGNLSITGAVEASTWVAIAGGTPYVDAAAEMVVANVFTPPA